MFPLLWCRAQLGDAALQSWSEPMIERTLEKLIWGLVLGLPIVAVPEALRGETSGAVSGVAVLFVIEAGLVFLMHRRGMWPFNKDEGD